MKKKKMRRLYKQVSRLYTYLLKCPMTMKFMEKDLMEHNYIKFDDLVKQLKTAGGNENCIKNTLRPS